MSDAKSNREPARRCNVFRLPTGHPADVAGLLSLIGSGVVAARDLRAIIGKTEGNGCVNDFTRPLALMSLQSALAGPLECPPEEVGRRIAMVMSGGTEGGLSPHLLVFASDDLAMPAAIGDGKRLAIGTAHTREFLPEEIGRTPQIDATAGAVEAAMAQAGISDPNDVHYVQVKCPLLTNEGVSAAAARGQSVATVNTYQSMAYSRGASALGVAVALGELARDALSDGAVCRRLDLWSARASTSAGIELMHNEVVVLGNAPGWASEYTISHGVMRDAIDLPAVLSALADVGVATAGQLDDVARERIVAVLAKADPCSTGRIRGARAIMLEDSDINATRHARAFVGGVLAGVIGRTEIFVSGGAEHQGPDGGGPIAVIARAANQMASSMERR